MKNFIIPSIVFAITSQYSFAQQVDKEKLDSYFKQLENNNKFMGSVAVS